MSASRRKATDSIIVLLGGSVKGAEGVHDVSGPCDTDLMSEDREDVIYPGVASLSLVGRLGSQFKVYSLFTLPQCLSIPLNRELEGVGEAV